MSMHKDLQKKSVITLALMRKNGGRIKPMELKQTLGISMRKVRYLLKLMTEEGMIVKHPDFYDLRTFWYEINEDHPYSKSEEDLFSILS